MSEKTARKTEPVSREMLRKKQAVLLDQVMEGFRQYPHFILEGDAARFQQFLLECRKLNGEESFADFYYGQLTKKDQLRFIEGLTAGEREALLGFVLEKGQVYYPLTEENLPFLSAVTSRGWLFSSFYFTRYPCTVWGNYDGKHPVFCRKEADLERYEALAANGDLGAIR